MAPRSAFDQLAIDLGLEPAPKAWGEMSSAEKTEATLREIERRKAELRFRVENFLKAASALRYLVYRKEGFVNEFVRDDILKIGTPLEQGILKAVLKQELPGRQRSGRLNSLRARVGHAELLTIRDLYMRIVNPSAVKRQDARRQFAEWFLYESPLGSGKKRGSKTPGQITAEIKALLERLVLAEKEIEGRARKPRGRLKPESS